MPITATNPHDRCRYSKRSTDLACAPPVGRIINNCDRPSISGRSGPLHSLVGSKVAIPSATGPRLRTVPVAVQRLVWGGVGDLV